MAKYDPLQRYLSRQKSARVILTFSEIERMVGGLLPKSAWRPQWWANEAADLSRHVQVRAWRSAGFVAFLERGERVRFERAERT